MSAASNLECIHTRTLLPFKVEAGACRGFPTTALLYEEVVVLPDGTLKKIPFRFEVGNSGEVAKALAGQVAGAVNPLGLGILRLIKMFKELENERAPLVHKADEFEQKLAAMQSRMHDLEVENTRLKLSARNGNKGSGK